MEAGRAQDSEEAPAPAPRPVQIGAPAPGAPRPLRTGSRGGHGGSGLQGWGDLAAACGVVPPGVTLCLGEAGLPGDRGLTGATAPPEPYTRQGGGAAPRCTHLRVSTAAPPPKTSWKVRARASSPSNTGKLQGKSSDLHDIEPEGTPPIFFLPIPLQLVFISDCKFSFFSSFPPYYNILPTLHF